MFDYLRRDSAKYNGQWYRRTGFWITVIYRFGNWADALPSLFLRVPMWTLYLCLKILSSLFTSHVILWAGRNGAHIGPGLGLIHPANILIGRDVVIGEGCQIYHEVTIGAGEIPGMAKIGNGVTIFPGARLAGGVVIGDKTLIGANCVVTKNVPSESVILAAPSRIIPRSFSGLGRRWDVKKEPLQPLNNPPSDQYVDRTVQN